MNDVDSSSDPFVSSPISKRVESPREKTSEESKGVSFLGSPHSDLGENITTIRP